MTTTREFRTTHCPACGTAFKYPYREGQTLYAMTCRRAACGEKFTVDTSQNPTAKVVVLRGGAEQVEEETPPQPSPYQGRE